MIKALNKKAIIAFLLSLSLVSCGTQQGERGPVGPQGEQGETGPQGPAGHDGVSVVSIDKTSSDGLVDTYTIFYSDGTSSSFNITNGLDGEQGIQGNPGQDGHNPVISIGSNGNWFVDGVDTSIKAQGPKGDTGEQGPQGEQGEKGQDGSSVLTGSGTPKYDLGSNGDSYINILTWDYYVKENDTWTLKGNIKGETGHDSDLYGVTYIVTFDVQDGIMPEGYETTVEVEAFHSISDLPTPTKTDYRFIGWYNGLSLNDGQFTTLTPVTRDMTVYARYESYPLHEVTFHSNGGNLAESWNVVHGFVIDDLPTIGREDYEFAGWYLDEQLENRISLPYTVLTQVDLWAKWIINNYSVTYVTNSEYTLDKTYFDAGTTVNELSTPTKPHYEFAGWYVDEYFETPFTYGNNIHSDITVYAKWSPIYHTVTWVRNSGQENLVNSWFDGGDIYGYGGYEGTYEGYNFAGWYYDEELTEPVNWPVVADRDYTFYAKWDWIDPYSDYILISNADELASIYKMDGKYLLTADIDMTDYQDVNVRFGTAENHFTGVFDGGGHRVYNYVQTRGTETNDFGLFGYNEGTITNLKISGTIQLGTWTNSNMIVGGIVAQNYGSIKNCESDLDITITLIREGNASRTSIIGGICGKNISGATISNCLNSGDVTVSVQDKGYASYGNFNTYVAGVAGNNTNSTIEKCVNVGGLTINRSTSGGPGSTRLSSIGDGGVIKDCLALANLGGSGISAVSDIGIDATVTNCYKINSMSYSSGTPQNKATAISKLVVNSSSLYSEDLLFDSTIWNYEELDFDNGITVRLR